MNTKNIFLFDLDGVVIKSRYFTHKYEQDFGVSHDAFAHIFSGDFRLAQIGKADLKEILQKELKNIKWEGTVDELLRYWFEYDNVVDTELISCIKELRKQGHLCYLVTQQEQYRYEYITRKLDFLHTFDLVFSSHMIGHSKAEEQFFSTVLDKIGRGENIVFFDDRQNFIDAAERTGYIRGILYRDKYDFDSFCKRKGLL